jgi:hypothetical protein
MSEAWTCYAPRLPVCAVVISSGKAVRDGKLYRLPPQFFGLNAGWILPNPSDRRA